MKGRLHHFAEGDMTIRQFIELHAPCLPESTVRLHLKAGRNSAPAMLTYNATAACKTAGRLGQRRFSATRARHGTKPSRFR